MAVFIPSARPGVANGGVSQLCRQDRHRGSKVDALCASLAPCSAVLDKLCRRGVKVRLWPREALISRCLAPRRGLPVQQSRWIRPAAGTPPVATSGVARTVRGLYLSHEVAALAKGYKVVERERPAVLGRQVHVDSATAQPAHSQSRVALKFAPPHGDLFAPWVGKGIRGIGLIALFAGCLGASHGCCSFRVGALRPFYARFIHRMRGFIVYRFRAFGLRGTKVCIPGR